METWSSTDVSRASVMLFLMVEGRGRYSPLPGSLPWAEDSPGLDLLEGTQEKLSSSLTQASQRGWPWKDGAGAVWGLQAAQTPHSFHLHTPRPSLEGQACTEL